MILKKEIRLIVFFCFIIGLLSLRVDYNETGSVPAPFQRNNQILFEQEYKDSTLQNLEKLNTDFQASITAWDTVESRKLLNLMTSKVGNGRVPPIVVNILENVGTTKIMITAIHNIAIDETTTG